MIEISSQTTYACECRVGGMYRRYIAGTYRQLSLLSRRPSTRFSYPCPNTIPVSGPVFGPSAGYQICNIQQSTHSPSPLFLTSSCPRACSPSTFPTACSCPAPLATSSGDDGGRTLFWRTNGMETKAFPKSWACQNRFAPLTGSILWPWLLF